VAPPRPGASGGRGEPLLKSLDWLLGEGGGAEWLAALPRLMAECAEQWGLRLGEPFAGSHVSLAVPAGDAVLKLNFPHEESAREPDALAHWGGDGAVRLLARDDIRRALLLERAEPGTQLWAEDDDAATAAAAAVLGRLHARPAPPGAFAPLAPEALRWARDIPRRWAAHGRPGDASVIARAARDLPELARTQGPLVVVHQDLHGGNVLRSARGPLAIDPKPLAGEAAFDCASLIRDRRPELLAHPHPRRVLERRLDVLTRTLGLDGARVRGWAIAHALAWGLEERLVHPGHLACAAWLSLAE
jgi:streptomycin 6-kinase